MSKLPFGVTVARLLIGLNALIWLGFGLIVASGAHPAMPDSSILRGMMAILGLLTAAALLVLNVFLGRRSRLAFTTAIVVLGCLAFLTIADQVGLADAAVLALTLAPLVCLIGSRGWFMAGGTSTPDANRGG